MALWTTSFMSWSPTLCREVSRKVSRLAWLSLTDRGGKNSHDGIVEAVEPLQGKLAVAVGLEDEEVVREGSRVHPLRQLVGEVLLVPQIQDLVAVCDGDHLILVAKVCYMSAAILWGGSLGGVPRVRGKLKIGSAQECNPIHTVKGAVAAVVTGTLLPGRVGHGGCLVLRVGRGGAEADHRQEGKAGENDIG